MAERALVFISCGQFHEHEKQLGKAIAQLANDMGLDGYFAENQNSLAGLASNIFAKLNQAAALVVVMHPRGRVEGLGGSTHIRASVWIEQEIAIGAFLQVVGEHTLKVKAFIHEDLNGMREGIRDQLQLNPTVFKNESEVLAELRKVFPDWRTLRNAGQRMELTPQIMFDNVQDNQNIRQVLVHVLLENTGSESVQDFRVDIVTPPGARKSGNQYVYEERNKDHQFFQQVTHRSKNYDRLYPGDKPTVLIYPILVDTFEMQISPTKFDSALITVTVHSSGMKKRTASRPLSDIGRSWVGMGLY